MSLDEVETSGRFAAHERQVLLDLALASIAQALRGEMLEPRLGDYPAALQQRGASFVTLYVAGALHGCIGSLEAHRPLVRDVVENARDAAFHDPRFPRLTHAELDRLHIHISVLSAPEPLRFVSEDDLLRQLRPGVDGLILTERDNRGTFLPAVWEALPDRRAFLYALKQKAGLAPDYWSDTIKAERYTAESLS